MTEQEKDQGSGDRYNETSELVPSLRQAPRAPEGMTEAEAEAARVHAAEMAAQIENATGGQQLAAIDRVSSMGVQSQRDAASELNLLRGRVGEMLTRGGAAGDLTKHMAELRLVLNEINPHEFQRGGVTGFLRHLPVVGRNGGLMRSLERVAIRYEPMSKQVAVIEGRLREGRAMLVKDNIELRKLYEQVEAQLGPVRKDAYLGQLLMNELAAMRERIDEPVKRERVTNVLHDVAMRVQDLRTMEEVHAQFFVSIEMTRENNNRLGQAVERTLTLGTNVITVGLAIQMALARQKRVLEATRRTREFLGSLIVANAAAIKRHTDEIGDVFNNPVIAMDKITQAHDDLVDAIERAARLKEEGIASARDNVSKLTALSAGLQQRLMAVETQSTK